MIILINYHTEFLFKKWNFEIDDIYFGKILDNIVLCYGSLSVNCLETVSEFPHTPAYINLFCQTNLVDT